MIGLPRTYQCVVCSCAHGQCRLLLLWYQSLDYSVILDITIRLIVHLHACHRCHANIDTRRQLKTVRICASIVQDNNFRRLSFPNNPIRFQVEFSPGSAEPCQARSTLPPTSLNLNGDIFKIDTSQSNSGTCDSVTIIRYSALHSQDSSVH